MPILRLNVTPNGLALHNSPADPNSALRRVAQGDGPIIFMLHGYKFHPGHRQNCPHRHILALTPDIQCRKALSWPRALGFDGDTTGEGLAIAFGWPARGSVWATYARAQRVGAELARAITILHNAAPHRPIHAIGHSMGARVILSALPHLAPNALTRALLLAGAEYSNAAETALDTPAGQTTEVINVISRENDLFDLALECLVSPPVRRDATIGHRFPTKPNTLTLQLDDPATITALARHGFPLAAPSHRICHWSAYLRQGVFPLYSALLRDMDRLPLDLLRNSLPERPHRRWSRLFTRPPHVAPAPVHPAPTLQ